MADDGSPSLPAPPGFQWDGPFLLPDLGDLPLAASDGAGSEAGGLDGIKADETCPVCQQILDAIAGMDEPERSRALVEYGRFSSQLEDGSLDRQALLNTIQDSPALKRALTEEIGVDGLEEKLRATAE